MAVDLVSVLLGGGFALGGAYLSPWMQARERKIERDNLKKSILRERGEELLALAAEVRAKTTAWSYQALVKDKTVDVYPFSKLHRMTAIIVIYFPELVPEIAAWRAEGSEELSKFKDDDSKREEFHKKIADMTSKLNDKFCGKVEDYIRNINKEFF